ncbi:hypothetical protein E4T43_06519 [Aureobasidium subglaciale]|nr:hypothetical protein E4T43_06519 [Aureobasidium subglaciale]
MPSFISAAVAALSLSSFASANVAYRRQESFPMTNSSSSSSQLSSSSASVPIGTGSSSIISSSTAGAGSGPGSSANSTATSTGGVSSTGSSASSTATGASPSVISIGGVTFSLEVDVTYSGVQIALDIVLSKRADNTLPECLSTCAANSQCAGTAFNSNTETCTFFSSIDANSRVAAPGTTFATVVRRADNGTNPTNGTTSTGATFPTGAANSTSTGATFPTTTNNGTSVTATPNNPGTNGTFPDAESIICPQYNDQVLQNNDGTEYLINCGLNIEGTVLSSRKARMIRRQSTFGNDWIIDCIDSCTALGNCVGTVYNRVQGTCTFYSNIESLFADANTDAAIIVNETPDATPIVSTLTVTDAGVTQTITTTPLTTSTVYSTTTKTIQSCAPGVPCVAATVTEVVVAYTTVCPVSAIPTGGAGAGAVITKTVCTACQYVPSVVTVYQCPTAGPGAGKPTAVTTKTVQVPVLNGPGANGYTTSTVYATEEHVTTTCGANGCNKATVTAVVSLYTTVCPISSGVPAPSAGQPGTVVVPGTTVPASTKPAETVPATVENGTTKPAETIPATLVPGTTKASSTVVKYSPTTSGVVAFTGAATKNGMGFAAAMAGVAALIL